MSGVRPKVDVDLALGHQVTSVLDRVKIGIVPSIGVTGGMGEKVDFLDFFDFGEFRGSGGVPGGSWRPWLHCDRVWAQTKAPGTDSCQI